MAARLCRGLEYAVVIDRLGRVATEVDGLPVRNMAFASS